MTEKEREYIEQIREGKQMREVNLIVEDLAAKVNSFDTEKVGTWFADAVTNHTHRTLQQNLMRIFLQAFQAWAKQGETGMCDLRNEATCKLAKKMLDAVKDETFLPTV